MKDTIIVKDGFCDKVDEARQSALESGFNTWKPNQGEIGSSIYEGMNFWGRHALLLRALSDAIGGKPFFPNNMFFRISTTKTERAYVHSDREWGNWTCIAYLSEHTEMSGTGFYRHRKTGLIEMPTLREMLDTRYAQLKKDMVEGGEKEWEQTDFVRGIFNRALLFNAPLFHSRLPKNGLGNSDQTARMVWVCHFET